jgi:hypothetical protein
LFEYTEGVDETACATPAMIEDDRSLEASLCVHVTGTALTSILL